MSKSIHKQREKSLAHEERLKWSSVKWKVRSMVEDYTLGSPKTVVSTCKVGGTFPLTREDFLRCLRYKGIEVYKTTEYVSKSRYICYEYHFA